MLKLLPFFSKFAKTLRMKIKQDVENYLKANQLTQAELAKQVGIHPITLNKLINRKHNFSAMDKLIDFLAKHSTTAEANV